MYINKIPPNSLMDLQKTTSSKNKINKSAYLDTANNKKDMISNNTGTVSDIVKKYDVKNITPNEMANMSQELYDSGNISFKIHAFLSFQPELNPSYESTIGKLTNSIAEPDKPMNFLGEWKGRLEHQLKSGVSNEIIENTKEVISFLDHLDTLRSNLLFSLSNK